MDLPAHAVVEPAEPATASAEITPLPVKYPRISIQFCTQCRWMLRAAYYAQELISTFGTALGEVALQPATGGVFRVAIEQDATTTTGTDSTSNATLLWDRAVDGGFPETKDLKRRVRDVIAPGRDLGHVDRTAAKKAKGAPASTADSGLAPASAAHPTETKKDDKQIQVCEDCQ